MLADFTSTATASWKKMAKTLFHWMPVTEIIQVLDRWVDNAEQVLAQLVDKKYLVARGEGFPAKEYYICQTQDEGRKF